MARLLYSLLLTMLAPVIVLRLYWRGRKQPAYRQHWRERWGCYGGDFRGKQAPPCLWVHAVSVGETRAAQPLLEALLQAFPDHHLLLTGMTPTGREAGQSVIAAMVAKGVCTPQRVRQVYLPYDWPGATQRFFAHFQPVLGVLMETEIWPNLLAAAERVGVPVALANARLSERSCAGYARFSALSEPAFRRLSVAAAQTPADAQRLQSLGAANVQVCGNLKFDVQPATAPLALGRAWADAWRAQSDRPVWLAASTREGEEPLVLAAYAALPVPRPLLVLVPRHPQRFAEVGNLLTAAGWRWAARSQSPAEAGLDVWLGDSMGEMPAYYALADLAFIGGSLLPLGGQNLIEAAACDCPVLVGPHTFNFAQATEDALACGAALRVADSAGLAEAVSNLLMTRPEQRDSMQVAARTFAASHRGATARVLALLKMLISLPAGPAGR